MLLPTLQFLFERDLNQLKSEIELYKNEKNIWAVTNDIANSAGNICLHLVGNLNTYIGARLGNSVYIRHRDAEFSTKNVTRAALIQAIEETQQMVKKALDELPETALLKDFPMDNPLDKKSTFHYLIHRFKFYFLAVTYGIVFLNIGVCLRKQVVNGDFILAYISRIIWDKLIIIGDSWINNRNSKLLF